MAARYYNDSVIALDILYEAALVSNGARQALRYAADRLMTRAAEWHELRGSSK